MTILLQFLGLVAILVALADVFLTVLVARYGTSLLSERIFSGTWRFFVLLGRRLSMRARSRMLIYAGPTALLLMFTAWVGLLQLGFALIYWPMLGSGLRSPSGGPVPHDFWSALYVSSDYLTTAGSADIVPATTGARVIMLLNGTVGISTITLCVTYLVQIYNALRERNAMALSLHHATGETGDAAEWIASLSAGGTFEGASSEVSRVASQVASNYETYHFYASLLYFHFAEVHYGQARVALVVMDASALASTAIDPQRHANFVRHGAVAQLGCAGLHVAQDLAGIYLPGGLPDEQAAPNAETLESWRQHYLGACERLAAADVSLVADAEEGFQAYAVRRKTWEPYVKAFAEYLQEPVNEVLAGAAPRPSPLRASTRRRGGIANASG